MTDWIPLPRAAINLTNLLDRASVIVRLHTAVPYSSIRVCSQANVLPSFLSIYFSCVLFRKSDLHPHPLPPFPTQPNQTHPNK